MTRRRLLRIISAVVIILSIPLIAMQFTSEVNWSFSDFMIMGVLLSITFFLIDFALRKINTKRKRTVAVIVIAAAFFIVWAELAVGILGSPFAGN